MCGQGQTAICVKDGKIQQIDEFDSHPTKDIQVTWQVHHPVPHHDCTATKEAHTRVSLWASNNHISTQITKKYHQIHFHGHQRTRPTQNSRHTTPHPTRTKFASEMGLFKGPLAPIRTFICETKLL